MGLSASFDADFNSFYQAVEQSKIKLVEWEKQGQSVEERLNRVANSLSGAKLIQDATLMTAAVEKLGGVSGLTEKELAKVAATAGEAAAKLTAMGREVPQGLQNIAAAGKETESVFSGLAGQLAGMFTVGALIGFGREVLRTTDEIQNMAVATGMTAEEVQRLQYVAASTGVPFTALVNAAQGLEQRLGDKNTGTIGAVEKLGLNLKELNQLSTHDKLYAVAGALKNVEDASTFASRGADLFGKSWITLAPAVKAGMDEIARSASVASAESVAATNQINQGWTNLTTSLKAGTIEIIGSFSLLTQEFGKFTRLEALNPEAWAAGWVKAFQDFAAGSPVAVDALDKMTAKLQERGAGLKDVTLSEEEYNAIIKESNQTLAESIAANKKMNEAQAELDSTGQGWQGTLAGINAEVVAAVKGYLEAGVTSTLQTAYGLTAAQVSAVARSLREEEQAQTDAGRAAEEAFKQRTRAIEATRQIWAEYSSDVMARSGTTTDQQIADVNRWAAQVAAVLAKTGALNQESMLALAATTKTKFDAILVDWEALSANSSEIYARTLDQQAAKAEATYQVMAQASSGFSVETIEHFRLASEAARDAADRWMYSWEQAATSATESVQRTAHAAQAASDAQGARAAQAQAAEQAAAQRGTFQAAAGHGGGGGGGGAPSGMSGFAPGAVSINTGEINFPKGVESAMKRYSQTFGTNRPWGGNIGGGPYPDFVSRALKQGSHAATINGQSWASYAPGGVAPGMSGWAHLAGGGVVRGTDTVPAMLTPGEVVLNRDQQRAFAGGRVSFPRGGNLSQGPTFNIALNGLLGTNDPQTRSLIEDLVGDAFSEAMRRQRLLSSA